MSEPTEAERLESALREHARSMPENDWQAFVAETRPPDTAQAFRTAAARHVSGDQLETVCRIADPSRFVGADGSIDEGQVSQHLGSLFGAGVPAASRNWGQHSGPGGPSTSPGAAARRALEKRHNVKNADAGTPGAPPPNAIRPGEAGRMAAERRHGKAQK